MGKIPEMINKEIFKQTRNTVLGNVLGNGIIAYLIKYKSGPIEPLGMHGYLADFLSTAFLLPAIIAAIFLFWFRRRVSSGEFVNYVQKLRLEKNLLPNNLWLASLSIGVLGFISVALPIGICLITDNLPKISPMLFALYKACWTGVASAVIVPQVIRHSLSTSSKVD